MKKTGDHIIIYFILIASLAMFTSSIALAEEDKVVNVFPNPVSENEELTIKSDKKISDILVLNIVGQKVAMNKYFDNQLEIKLNVNGIKPGVYLLRISFTDQTATTQRIWVK